jgi:hypothetical protein
MKNLFFNLPQDILGKIYLQDNTYTTIFTNQVLNNIHEAAVTFWKMKYIRNHNNKLSLEKFDFFLNYLIALWCDIGKTFNDINEISLLSNNEIYIYAKINGDEFLFTGGIYNTEEIRNKNHQWSNPYVIHVNVFGNHSLHLLEFLR